MRLRGTLALAALVLPATPGGEASAEERARTITITADEFRFQPESLEVEEGRTVRLRFRNEGALAHSLEIEEIGASTPAIQGGAQRILRFRADETGSYRNRCTVPGHEEAGMTGTLRVVEGS